MPRTVRWNGFEIATARIAWKAAIRLIFGKRRTIDPFEDLADGTDLDILKELEGETNERLLLESGQVPVAEDLNLAAGPNAGVQNAPLAHRKIIPARFAEPGDRVGHFSRELDTAIAETLHRQQRRARRNHDPAYPIMMRVLSFQNVRCEAHELRGLREDLAGVYHPDDYAESIALARTLRREGDSDGVVYDSVRRANGTNLGLFRRRYDGYVDAGFIEFDWDGERIRDWYRVA